MPDEELVTIVEPDILELSGYFGSAVEGEPVPENDPPVGERRGAVSELDGYLIVPNEEPVPATDPDTPEVC